MLSLLGSLLGFGTSFLPKIMDYFQDKQDKLHELAMMDKQLDQQIALADKKMEMVRIDADVREIESAHKEQASVVRKGSTWLANLSGSIRPVLTYVFTIEFICVTWSMAYLVIGDDGFTIESLRKILDEDFMGLYSAMVSFWFGNRTFGRRRV